MASVTRDDRRHLALRLQAGGVAAQPVARLEGIPVPLLGRILVEDHAVVDLVLARVRVAVDSQRLQVETARAAQSVVDTRVRVRVVLVVPQLPGADVDLLELRGGDGGVRVRARDRQHGRHVTLRGPLVSEGLETVGAGVGDADPRRAGRVEHPHGGVARGPRVAGDGERDHAPAVGAEAVDEVLVLGAGGVVVRLHSAVATLLKSGRAARDAAS